MTAAILMGIGGGLVGFLAGSFWQFRADYAQVSRNRERRKRKAESARRKASEEQKHREIFDALTDNTIRIPLAGEE